MSDLKRSGVLSSMEISAIERHYNKVEQCNTLIMQMVDETDENVWKFCRCLRESYKMLADLIENTTDDGTDIGKY